MSTITRYTFEDAAGCEDSYTTMDPREAEARGRSYGMRVIAHEYEWADSEVAWDFTETETETEAVCEHCGAACEYDSELCLCSECEKEIGQQPNANTKGRASCHVNRHSGTGPR